MTTATQTTCETYEVANWPEAGKKLEEIVGGQEWTLGSGYDYPKPYAVFYMDAWSGEGIGYRVWTTQGKRLHRLIAYINIGRASR